MKQLMTKKQEEAIDLLNKALKNAHKCKIMLAGCDSNLYYATQQVVDLLPEPKPEGDFPDVIRAQNFVEYNEGCGKLFRKCYEDSCGW